MKQPDGSEELVTQSISNTLNFWSVYNDCRGQITSKRVPQSGRSAGTQVGIFSADDCKQDSAVVLYKIDGAGHNWPGVAGVIPEAYARRVNMDIHASDEIWSFFQKYTRHQSNQ